MLAPFTPLTAHCDGHNIGGAAKVASFGSIAGLLQSCGRVIQAIKAAAVFQCSQGSGTDKFLRVHHRFVSSEITYIDGL